MTATARRRRRSLTCLLLLTLASTSPTLVADDAPVTQPTTRSTADARATDAIAAAYQQLASGNAGQRYDARLALMGLSRDELPTLLTIAKSNLPVTPAQALALREVVLQVWLATEPMDASRKIGFLGVSGVRGSMSVAVTDPDEPGEGFSGGVIFDSRTPGFCANRWLQDGDVILAYGVAGEGGGAVNHRRVRMAEDLINLVQATRPGTTISLRVLRGGSVVTLTFVLDACPDIVLSIKVGEVTPNQFKDMMTDRMTRAEAYWRATFAPLIDPDYT